jgi:hypothetical protein
MKLGINELWATKVLYTKFRDNLLRQELVTNILENLDIYLNSSKEKYDDNIFNLDFSILKKFRENEVLPLLYEYLEHLNVHIYECDVKLKSWIPYPNDPYYMPYHNHKGSSISAVFYPFFIEQNIGGEIVLHDPRSNANRGYIKNFSKLFEPVSITPSTGDVLIFPSFLYHHVNPYKSSNRMAIAVDYFFID